MELIKFIFSGFWIFIGSLVFTGIILRFVFIIWNRFWRHWTLRKHGYPPIHCDADGDFKTTEKE